MGMDRCCKDSGGKESPATAEFVRAIRRSLYSGELRGGSPLLSERELSGLHKVSRTAVRIGLKQLDALGILGGRKSSTRLLVNSAESLFSNFLVFQPPAERDFRKVIEVGCIDAVIANADGKHVNELRRINAGIIS